MASTTDMAAGGSMTSPNAFNWLVLWIIKLSYIRLLLYKYIIYNREAQNINYLWVVCIICNLIYSCIFLNTVYRPTPDTIEPRPLPRVIWKASIYPARSASPCPTPITPLTMSTVPSQPFPAPSTITLNSLMKSESKNQAGDSLKPIIRDK